MLVLDILFKFYLLSVFHQALHRTILFMPALESKNLIEIIPAVLELLQTNTL